MLRRLAERHGRLPDRMMITETMEVSEKIVASGGCGDIRTGTYMGGLVAVKTARVAARDNFKKIKKVSFNEISVLTEDTVSMIPPSNFTGRFFSGKLYPIQTS